MARSTHPNYDAATIYERRQSARSRRYRRHLTALAIRAEMGW